MVYYCSIYCRIECYWSNCSTLIEHVFLKSKGPMGVEPIPQEPESYTLSIKLWALKIIKISFQRKLNCNTKTVFWKHKIFQFLITLLKLSRLRNPF